MSVCLPKPEEEEEREPALGIPWGEGLRMGYRETKVQIPSLRGTPWGLDPPPPNQIEPQTQGWVKV